MTDRLTEAEWADLQTMTTADGTGEVRVFAAVFDKLIAEVRASRAASAQREADVVRAKLAVLDELYIRYLNLLPRHGFVRGPAWGQAWDEGFAKYSEPTAVAATEKEG